MIKLSHRCTKAVIIIIISVYCTKSTQELFNHISNKTHFIGFRQSETKSPPITLSTDIVNAAHHWINAKGYHQSSTLTKFCDKNSRQATTARTVHNSLSSEHIDTVAQKGASFVHELCQVSPNTREN